MKLLNLILMCLTFSGCTSSSLFGLSNQREKCPPNELEYIQENFTKKFDNLPVNIEQNVVDFSDRIGPIPDSVIEKSLDFWNECFPKPIFSYDKTIPGKVFVSCLIDEKERSSILGIPTRFIGSTTTIGNNMALINLVICEDNETLSHELGHALGFDDSEMPSIMSHVIQRPGYITQGIVDSLLPYLN